MGNVVKNSWVVVFGKEEVGKDATHPMISRKYETLQKKINPSQLPPLPEALCSLLS